MGKFKERKEDGVWTDWYENGQKESEATYKDGELDSKWISWHENGQKSIPSMIVPFT
jgi:antitoxin component YwqK of YwqJK toxin-antitoxin module